MSTPTIRVFVSSTFADFERERNRLTEIAYPELVRVCQRFGATFQAVDLRWGISPSAGQDQQTLDLCLEELRRCQRVSPRPNFVFLLGNRYGWRPAPPFIPADEFETLQNAVPDSAPLLHQWYTLDHNAIPPEYRLNAITDANGWAFVEINLRTALLRALDQLGWPADDPRRERYELAVTHREILAGVLRSEGQSHSALGHVFGYFRSVDGLPELAPTGNPARSFADYNPDGSHDADALVRLNALRHELSAQLPAEQQYEFGGSWNGRFVECDLDAFCQRFVADLTRIIEAELSGPTAVPVGSRERMAHVDFGASARIGFTGQLYPLGRISGYLQHPEAVGPPMVIAGPPGAGKTALVSEAMSFLPPPEAAVVIRYLGITPASSRLSSLLTDLCDQLAEEFPDAGFSPPPTDPAELANEFRRRVLELSEGRPLIIVLDAVDQLPADEGAHNLHWVPTPLPPHVRMILTLTDNNSELLDSAFRVSGGRVFPLKGLSDDSDPGQLLDQWLESGDHPRTLTPAQRDAVLDRFSKFRLPLFLRLLAEQARRWRSADPIPALPHNTAEAAAELFERLEEESNHGTVLVRAAAGYLAASPRGVSETEMLDLLSTHSTVMADFVRRSPTEQRKAEETRVRQLPPIVWSRLADDLRPFLTERDVPGGRVLDFYHQEIEVAADRRYLQNGDDRAAYESLADYYSAQPDFLAPGIPNGRKADQLPFVLYTAGRYVELVDTLTGDSAFPFLEASVAAGMTNELVQSFRVAEHHAPDDHPRKRFLPLLADALRRHITTLRSSPSQLLRCLWAECWWYDSSEAAPFYPPPEGGWPEVGPPWERSGPKLSQLLERWRAEKEKADPDFVWLRALRPPQTGLGAAASVTLQGHIDQVTELVFHPNDDQALSRSADGTVRLWNLSTGRELRRFPCNAFRIEFTTAGPRAIVIGEGNTVEVWDVVTGTRIMATTPIEEEVQQLALSPDGRALAVASFTIVAYLYVDPDSEEPTTVPADEMNEVLDTAYRRRGMLVAMQTRNAKIDIWDTTDGEKMGELPAGENGVGAMAFSLDGSRLAFAVNPAVTFIINLTESGLPLTLSGQSAEVDRFVFSPDGTALAAETNEGVIVWSLCAEPETAPTRLSKNSLIAVWPPEGLLLAGHIDGEFRIVNCFNGEDIRIAVPSSIYRTVLASNGQWASGLRQDDYAILVWCVQGGDVAARMTDTGDKFAFSPDGKILVSFATDRPTDDGQAGTGIRIWNADTSRSAGWLEGACSRGDAFRFHPNVSYLAATFPGEYRIWHIESRRLVASVRRSDDQVAFVGSAVWLLSEDHDIRLWRQDQPDRPWRTLSGHTHKVTEFAFSPVGPFAASGTDNGIVQVWDIETGAKIAQWQAHDKITALAYSRDGARIATGGKDGLRRIWEAQSGKELARMRHAPTDYNPFADNQYVSEAYRKMPYTEQQDATVLCVAFSEDGKQLVSGSRDETIRVWDVDTSHERACLRGSANAPDFRFGNPVARYVAFISDDQIAAVCVCSGYRWKQHRTYFRWNWQTGERQCEKELPSEIWSCGFSSDGEDLPLFHKEIIHWADSYLLFRPQEYAVGFSPNRAFFSPNNDLLILTEGEAGGAIWDRFTKTITHRFQNRQGEIIGGRMDNGVPLLASRANGSTPVRVDLVTGKSAILDQRVWDAKEFAVSDDGKRLAVRTRDRVVVCDAITGWMEKESDGKEISDIHFPSDELLALIAGRDKPITVWELGTEIRRTADPKEAAEIRRAANALISGLPMRIGFDPKRLKPPVAGEIELRTADRMAWIERSGFAPLLLTEEPTAQIAVTPDGRTWALQLPDGWRCFTIEGIRWDSK